MVRAAEVTGDAKFNDYVKKHTEFLAKVLPFFRATAEKYGTDKMALRACSNRVRSTTAARCARRSSARVSRTSALISSR